jgi:hypothetical protein
VLGAVIRRLNSETEKRSVLTSRRAPWPSNKFLKLFVTLYEDFFVCDGARDLERKDEAGRRLNRPIIHGLDCRAAVKRRVHLDGVEAR